MSGTSKHILLHLIFNSIFFFINTYLHLPFVYEPVALVVTICVFYILFFFYRRFGAVVVWVVCCFINNLNVPILAQNGAYNEFLYVRAVALYIKLYQAYHKMV